MQIYLFSMELQNRLYCLGKNQLPIKYHTFLMNISFDLNTLNFILKTHSALLSSYSFFWLLFSVSRWELEWWFCLICHLFIWGSHDEDYRDWTNPPQRDRLFLRLFISSSMYVVSGSMIHSTLDIYSMSCMTLDGKLNITVKFTSK